MVIRVYLIISFWLFLSSIPVFSQVSELHLDDLANCIPLKHKDDISLIEQSYKDGAILYSDATNVALTDQEKLDKLNLLFKVQFTTKSKMQEIWEHSDSVSRNNSSKYFNEASTAFKSLTDTLNLANPSFRTLKGALIVVEKTHQVILLQKFGLQILFGCVRESTSSGKLGQPSDIPDIVINIDMIERFRKVWNESNSPLTYDQWVYTPTERKPFSAQSLSDSYKNRFNETKKNSDMNNILNQNNIDNQGSLAFNSSNTRLNGSINDSNDKTGTSLKGNINKKDNNRSTIIENAAKESNKSYSIKGESTKFSVNKNTQYEIKDLVLKSKIKTLGVDYFTIQVAASKNQLVLEKLRSELYCSTLKVEEKNEDGWYKYLIGQFSTIDSAIKFLAKPCITRGFVSGYNSKGRVAIFSIKQQVIPSIDTSVYSIVYRVQIAASRQPLSNETITAVYKGSNPVNVFQEDGWYKYSIGDFIYYNEAKTTRDSCGTKGAFVMPYQNQKRIQWPKKEAMEMLKMKQSSNSIYVVQVAASRKPLPLHIIHDIIKIDYPLTMKIEDGWYKYYISAFTNFTVAKEVATKIGIKGAFIATYRNGIRIKP